MLAAATRNGARAKSTQVALDRAQQEMEKLHSLPYEELALTRAPSHSPNPLNPNHRVVNGNFALQREPVGEYAPMVTNVAWRRNAEQRRGQTGADQIQRRRTLGHLYRYIVWRNDKSCPESETGEDLCPGFKDYKQIVVAVKLDATGSEPRERNYIEVQSAALDPNAVATAPT